ncbi:MAG: V-type ATP synthase subunit D [Candidatus Omnitrophica bacterium]|nr:V-type ATP synthase subunit D [Candidatus Omnitrophota bacterium]
MAKIKLTKSELKKQRDSLDQFSHYLPTLQLKKQQLQIKVFEIRKSLAEKQAMLDSLKVSIDSWIGLLSDPGVDIEEWIIPQNVSLATHNIAGADIPVFEKVEFKNVDYDLYVMPFWVDEGIEIIKKFFSFLLEIEIIKKQIVILQKELMTTTQRVNLFEKVKIPECLENIRKIRIYLGDQQASAVGVSKVAKKKIEQAVLAEMGV